MKRRIVIFVIRAIGTLAGLLGASMLYSISYLTSGMKDTNSWISYSLFVGLPLVISLICIWIAYLVWFRFSPRAVQQVCGLLGFLLACFVMTEFPPADKTSALQPLAFIGSIVFALISYRLLARYLNAIVFGGERICANKPSTN